MMDRGSSTSSCGGNQRGTGFGNERYFGRCVHTFLSYLLSKRDGFDNDNSRSRFHSLLLLIQPFTTLFYQSLLYDLLPFMK